MCRSSSGKLVHFLNPILENRKTDTFEDQQYRVDALQIALLRMNEDTAAQVLYVLQQLSLAQVLEMDTLRGNVPRQHLLETIDNERVIENRRVQLRHFVSLTAARLELAAIYGLVAKQGRTSLKCACSKQSLSL